MQKVVKCEVCNRLRYIGDMQQAAYISHSEWGWKPGDSANAYRCADRNECKAYLETYNAEKENMENEKAELYKAKIVELETELTKFVRERNVLEARAQDARFYKDECEEYKARLVQLETDLTEAVGEKSRLLARVLELEQDKGQDEARELARQLDTAKNKINILRAELDRAYGERNDWQDRANNFKDDRDRLMNDMGKLHGRLAEVSAEKDRLRSIIAKAVQELGG